MSILTSADCMPTISITEIDKDELKGKWVDIEETSLIEMFASVILSNEQLGPEFNFHEVKDAQYFSEKFPGFSDEIYEILAKEQHRLDNEKTPEDEFLHSHGYLGRIGDALPEESMSEIKNRHM